MNKTSWMFIVSTSLLLLVFGFFFLWPTGRDTYKYLTDKTKVENDLKNINDRAQILAKLYQNKDFPTVYDNAAHYIPEKENSSDLVLELSSIANQSNLKLEQISIDSSSQTKSNDDNANKSDNKDKKKVADEVKFNLRVNGKFSDFQKFLQKSESTSRFISFDNINLSNDKGNLIAQISGRAFWQKPKQIEVTQANLNVTEAIMQKFLSLKSYSSQVINNNDKNFGRTDPFAAY